MINPGAGPQLFYRRLVRSNFQEFVRCDRNDGRVVRKAAVKSMEKFFTIVVVMLPCIFTIQDHGNQVRSFCTALFQFVADGVYSFNEVLCSSIP